MIQIAVLTIMAAALGGSYISWRMWQYVSAYYLCFLVEIIAFAVGWILLLWKKIPRNEIAHFVDLSMWLLLPIPSYIVKEALLIVYPNPYTFIISWMAWLGVYVVMAVIAHLLVKRVSH